MATRRWSRPSTILPLGFVLHGIIEANLDQIIDPPGMPSHSGMLPESSAVKSKKRSYEFSEPVDQGIHSSRLQSLSVRDNRARPSKRGRGEVLGGEPMAPSTSSAHTDRILWTSWGAESAARGPGKDASSMRRLDQENDPLITTYLGRDPRGTRSESVSTASTSFISTRGSRQDTSPTRRRDQDNDALVTMSLRRDPQDGRKESERTSNYNFDQITALNGEPVDTPEDRSPSTACEATWTRQQYAPLTPSNTSCGPLNVNIILDQDDIQVLSTDPDNTELAVASGEATTGELTMDVAQPPPIVTCYQQFFWNFNTTDYQDTSYTVSNEPDSSDLDAADMLLSLQHEVPDTTATGDGAATDVDVCGVLLSLQHEVLDSTAVLPPIRAFMRDHEGRNGIVPALSVFGTGTTAHSMSLSGRNFSHPDPSSMTFGRTRMNTGMSGAHSGYHDREYGDNSAGSFGAGAGHGGRLSDPLIIKTTTPESKPSRSTSSIASTMPAPDQDFSPQARLDRALHENQRLWAFIREHFGPHAEAEANAMLGLMIDY
ncbi:hypothetical protein BGW39_000972 [Mortierella sp. 14UC]|nr:hypothetical protein BGW39_000972 [Mortierella sp. 14UC]